MEATGVYWIPIFEILDARGFQVILVNARHVKNLAGRKSDVSDCEWLCDLHTLGLLRGSFRPADGIVALRGYQSSGRIGHHCSPVSPGPGEPLRETRRDGVTWSAELRYQGEYGVEGQTLRNGELALGRRFHLRRDAEAWGEQERRDLEAWRSL